ncbi:MAG: suppressor of fused domain protein, partial [Gemmataceae bacterium]|nr:suppressor of fused domain protein [Gemmataceae bacterium]
DEPREALTRALKPGASLASGATEGPRMAKKGNRNPTPAPDPDPPESRGWDAISAACDRLYPDQPEPLHSAPPLHPPFSDGLIYGISIYRAADPSPHWHFVTFGFSELYEKESDDPDVSGWGFELTFRLTRVAEEDAPPNWALNFLDNLGKYVRRSGNPFGSGHILDLNGPIAWGTDTLIRAIAFTTDSQLGAIDTPNGRVEFLQIVGLTTDEHDACSDWHTTPILDLLRESNPLLVTDLDRASTLADPAVKARAEAGIDTEGSQSPLIYVSVAGWKVAGRGKSRTATATLGARAVGSLLPKLRSRLAHGRSFALIGREQLVSFRPGSTNGWQPDAEHENTLAVNLTPALLAKVRETLKPVRGRYEWPELPGFVLQVEPSNITDSDGNVIEVVG